MMRAQAHLKVLDAGLYEGPRLDKGPKAGQVLSVGMQDRVRMKKRAMCVMAVQEVS